MSASDGFVSDLLAWAEGWLGRPLSVEDGVGEQSLAGAADRLGIPIPFELSTLYLRVGRVEALMRGFEGFREVDAWEVEDGKLLFLDENQGACSWGVDHDGQVWMLTEDGFSAEGVALAEFLLMLLPLQLAQGGWPNCSQGMVAALDLDTEMARIASDHGWPLVVERRGLRMYGSGGHLLWALDPDPDEATASIFLSSREVEDFARLTEALGFDEL